MQEKTYPSPGFLILCLILLTIGFRIVHLKADPPADLSWSGGYFADEGFWSHNARNQVLFGNPVQDEWDARIVSPLFARIQGFVFQVLGAGFAQVRLIALFSSIVITVSCFLLLRRQMNVGTAFLCTVLISLNYPMLILGRQGILDPFAAALMCVSLLLLFTETRTGVILAGVCLVASCVTKYLMVYAFLPFLFAMLFVLRFSKHKLVLFFTGALITLGAWYLGNYIPNRELLQGYSSFYSSQQSWELLSVAKNIVLQPFYLYFVKTPAILFFGNLFLWYFLAKPAAGGRIEKLFWVWLVCGILFFALWKYRPLRYYTSLLIPLSVLAGIAATRFRELASGFEERPTRLYLLIGMLIPSAQLGFVLADRWSGWNILPSQLGIQSWDIITFLALTVVFILMNKKVSWMVLSFAVAFLLCDMKSYLSWALQPEYAAVELSRDLERRVGKGVLTGQWAPELCLENQVRVVPVWHGFVNSEEPFERYGISHVLVWEYPLGGEKFDQWYPEEFRQFLPVAHYRIKNSDLVLYERK